jgi:hypothetical protein
MRSGDFEMLIVTLIWGIILQNDSVIYQAEQARLDL